MLSLWVRTTHFPDSIDALAPVPAPVCTFFPQVQETYCCRSALAYIKRLLSDPKYPEAGGACVSVIRFPEDSLQQIQNKHYRIGELVMHAVRYDGRRDPETPGSVEIPISPPAMASHLPVKALREDPLLVDLRHVDPQALPADIRDIVPDERLRNS